MIADTAPTCLRCKQLDAVRKVSALYREGFSSTQYEVAVSPYSTEKRWATSRTSLSQKLVCPGPPAKPELPQPVLPSWYDKYTNMLLYGGVIVGFILANLIYAGIMTYFFPGANTAALKELWCVLSLGAMILLPILLFNLPVAVRASKRAQQEAEATPEYKRKLAEYQK